MLIPINNTSYSTVNGPGYRYVLWVQGCKLNCKDCFNPETHLYNVAISMDIENIALEINSNPFIEGITISGGEPLDYSVELIGLLKLVKQSLTTIIFTGYTIKEIAKDSDDYMQERKSGNESDRSSSTMPKRLEEALAIS